MPKEDRSDWVAVAPEFSSNDGGNKIKPAVSAFTFFQRDVSHAVKTELMARNTKFQVGEFTKAVRDRWNNLNDGEREQYDDMSRKDRMRFASESHAADVAALQRRERLQQEREALLLDDEGGNQRSTRHQYSRKERKRERREKKKLEKEARRSLSRADKDEFVEEESESSGSYEDETDSDSESDQPSMKRRAPRQLSQKQIEQRAQRQNEKLEKEAIIAERQEDLRKEKAQQAKRRLEFLLKQSNIFSHFGQVKQDQATYGITTKQKKDDPINRRASIDDSKEDEELEEADTHQATFLTAQPTTLAFGQMRQYQLEGLNWMIRLQENGVNGILADEVSSLFPGGTRKASMHDLIYCEDGTRENLAIDIYSRLHAGISEQNWASFDCCAQKYPQQLDERAFEMGPNT